MGVFSSPPEGENSDLTDPVSWLQIAQGWNVVASDGVVIGTVAQVEVGLIYPDQVTLKIASAEADALEPFQAPPPETKWLPGKTPLGSRLSRWMRGGR